jgi:hypothetical protein
MKAILGISICLAIATSIVLYELTYWHKIEMSNAYFYFKTPFRSTRFENRVREPLEWSRAWFEY